MIRPNNTIRGRSVPACAYQAVLMGLARATVSQPTTVALLARAVAASMKRAKRSADLEWCVKVAHALMRVAVLEGRALRIGGGCFAATETSAQPQLGTTWGTRILEVRNKASLSRHDFGLRIGEPSYLVKRWELEGSEPLAHTALHIALRLALQVDDLIGTVRPYWWGFTSSTRVGKADTHWRENIMALAEVAGSRAALARDLGLPKIMTQSWVHRRSIPRLPTAAQVSAATGIDLHDLLTVAIDAEAGVAYARSGIDS